MDGNKGLYTLLRLARGPKCGTAAWETHILTTRLKSGIVLIWVALVMLYPATATTWTAECEEVALKQLGSILQNQPRTSSGPEVRDSSSRIQIVRNNVKVAFSHTTLNIPEIPCRLELTNGSLQHKGASHCPRYILETIQLGCKYIQSKICRGSL